MQRNKFFIFGRGFVFIFAQNNSMQTTTSQAILAGGCFWCTEAVFLKVRGVQKVIPGYIGGRRPNPTYEQICTGHTGHAEAIQIDFDPEVISFEMLLNIFFATHDPTTLNRQGNDIGTQYRSAIFYIDQAQKQAAEQYLEQLKTAEIFEAPVVTKLEEATVFYPAEAYHHNYYNRNPEQGYCSFVISPKVSKLRKYFADWLKD